MLEKLLDRSSFVKKLRGKQRHSKDSKKRPAQWSYLAYLPAWVLFAFMVSILATSAITSLLEWIHMSPEQYLSPTAYQLAVTAMVYIFSLIIAAGVPYLFKRKATSLQDVGLARLMSWTDIGLAPVVFIAYIVTVTVVTALIAAWFPGFSVNEAQDVGFSLFGSQFDNVLTFLALVVIAPLAEEILFRGYLYGKLKSYVPALWAAAATSLLFGLVHLQWNVAIDVFVLSMFLCGLRSITGNIWAGILVHSMKNAVAYFILISPFIIGG